MKKAYLTFLTLALFMPFFSLASVAPVYGGCEVVPLGMLHYYSDNLEPDWLLPEFEDDGWEATNGYQNY
jgi:hypothetical protein